MDDQQIDEAAARQIAADGLRLALSGDDEAGLARYRSIARPLLFKELPLGLHVRMLRGAGREAAADALTGLAIKRGGDLTWRGRQLGCSAEVAVAEYEAFLAQGLVNAKMVGSYISLLTSLGRTEDVSAIFDPARLFHAVRISAPDPDGVARALLDCEAAALDVTSSQSVRKMRQVKKLGRLAAFAPVLAACEAEARAYHARWAASDHPLAPVVPRDFEMNAWGLISRGEGYNVRHNHPVGWATGVYYPVGLPADITGGSLCIGGSRDPAPPGWPEIEVRPEAGLLVLMPSYYIHWTRPLGAPGLRMAVAFDAVPA